MNEIQGIEHVAIIFTYQLELNSTVWKRQNYHTATAW